jgi:acetylornithine deacetylase/succinyl-diaminopimelate desuccinylase-like protein
MSDFIEANFPREVEFLKALVRVPSDNPPGDCDRHAEESARLLEGMGFTVERHKVPDDIANQHGMVSATNLIVRERFGSGKGPVIALNAHGDVVPPGEGWRGGKGRRDLRSRCGGVEIRLRDLRLRAAGAEGQSGWPRRHCRTASDL